MKHYVKKYSSVNQRRIKENVYSNCRNTLPKSSTGVGTVNKIIQNATLRQIGYNQFQFDFHYINHIDKMKKSI